MEGLFGASQDRGSCSARDEEEEEEDWQVAFDMAFDLAVEAEPDLPRPDQLNPKEAMAIAEERQKKELEHVETCRDYLENNPEERDIAALLKSLRDTMATITTDEKTAEQEPEAEGSSVEHEMSGLLDRARREAARQAEEAKFQFAKEVEAQLATFQAAQSKWEAAKGVPGSTSSSSTTAEAKESVRQNMERCEIRAAAWEEAGRACGEAAELMKREAAGEGWASWMFAWASALLFVLEGWVSWAFALLVVFGLHVTPLALAFPSSSFVWRGLAVYILGRVVLQGFLWLEGRVAAQRKWVAENRKWAKTAWKENKKFLLRVSMATSMLIAAGLAFGV